MAVPPILEAKTSEIRNGIGLISNFFAMANVMGITKITVVTLSRNALTNPVKSPNVINTATGRPLVSPNRCVARKLNTPLFAVIETIIIIDISKKITLKSIKFTKYRGFIESPSYFCWLNKPKATVKQAPINATVTLLIFSVAIKIYATKRIDADNKTACECAIEFMYSIIF